MRTLFGVVLLLLIGLAVAGFYRGWFHLSTNSTDQTSGATITVDQNKIRADESKAKEKAEAFGQKTK
jgi:preprotein translocase subunit SecF